MDLKVFKNNPIEAGPKDDLFKNDRLKREQSILNLTKLVNGIDQPFVLSINGSWGSGKTSFIKLWKGYLENQGHNCLNFNAWENDFSKDPFLTIVSEIKDQITQHDEKTNGKVTVKAKEVYAKGMALALKSLPVLIKALSSGMLSLEMIKGVVGNSQEGLSDIFSDISKNLVHEKNLQKEFRESLERLAEEVGENKKIVFFIDELDRCRPTYSVELLENIKHFFNVQGIVFVLAIDKQQLGYSLQTLYGANMDTEGYLRRFIDLNFNLPNAEKDDFLQDLPQFCEIRKYIQGRQGLYKVFFKGLEDYANIFKLSLRDLEHLYTQASIAIRFFDTEHLIQETLIPFLLVLRIKHFNYYQEFISKKNNANELLQSLLKIREFEEYLVNIKVRTRFEVSLFLAEVTKTPSRNVLNSMFLNVEAKYDTDILNQFETYKIGYNHNDYLKRIEEIIEFSGRFQWD